MNRIEFMKELEYLLQDIPEEEKADALFYYRDYLDDAGDENEQGVLAEFGSPVLIAAMIRFNLRGGMGDGGEFTEKGIKDSRFEDPRYRLAKRTDLSAEEPGVNRDKRGRRRWNPENKGRRLFLLVLFLFLVSPLLFGLSGTAVGLLAGLIGVVIVLGVGIAVATIALFVSSFAVLAVSFATLFVDPLRAMALFGGGIMVLGLALLSFILSVLFYGKLMPRLLRKCIDILSGFFRKRGGRVHESIN